jgi:hypothetical protein
MFFLDHLPRSEASPMKLLDAPYAIVEGKQRKLLHNHSLRLLRLTVQQPEHGNRRRCTDKGMYIPSLVDSSLVFKG